MPWSGDHGEHCVSHRRPKLLWVTVIFLAAVRPVGAERYAVEIRFAPRTSQMDAMPVVLTGAELYLLTGAVCPAASSVRVLLNGEEQSCQVDERDESGRYTESNGVVDHNDEIVFYVDFEKEAPTTISISWASTPEAKAEPPADAGQVRIAKDEKTPYVDLWAETEQFRLGLNATGLEDPAAHNIANYGRAAFSVLAFNGKPLTAITSAWSNVLPIHPFGYGAGKLRWQELKVVKQGPIRTLITTECPEYEQGVRAEFAIYNRGPAIDLAYSMRYVRQEPEKRPLVLSFGYPLRLGRKGDVNDLLMVPVAGRVHKHRLTMKDLEAFYPTHYQTPLPQEGWFAWVDTAEEVGLAVFYEKMAAIRDRAEWVDSRPVSNPDVRIRTTPSGQPENYVRWHRRSVHTARTWNCQNRFVGLKDADETRLRLAYDLWAKPLDELADVSLPRRIDAK